MDRSAATHRSSPCQVKFFLWLADLDRRWTADRLKRHGLTHKASLCPMRPMPRNNPAPPGRLPVLAASLVQGALLAVCYMPATTTMNQARRLVTHRPARDTQTTAQGPGVDDSAHLLAVLETA